MNLLKKYAKRCNHCNRNCLLPYEYEWTCISCGFNVIKQKHQLSKIQRRKMNFINRLKHAEQKIFCICLDIYKFYEGNDYNKIYDVLSSLKNIKLKINNNLIEIYIDMLKNPDFEQNHYSITSSGIYTNCS